MIDADEELGQAIAEFLELERNGRAPPLERFVDAHPAIASALRECLMLVCELGSHDGPLAPALPERIGTLRIVREIGRGGMGVVYEAEQSQPARHVALKLLPQEAGRDASRRARFHREIESTARLRHPALVPVLEAGEHDGLLYYTMPLLEGRSLDREVAARRSSSQGAPLADRDELVVWLRRVIDLARGIAHAHAHGVLHRDIKPSNLFLESCGRLLLLDFGLTRSIGADASQITQQPVGTPRYMSPEQIRGRGVDARSDQFSLAATLCELLTLEPVFDGSDIGSVYYAILHRDPALRGRAGPRLPRDLEVIVLKALEKDPARRYADVSALADDLQRFVDYKPILARPLGPLGRAMRTARSNPAAALSLLGAGLVATVLPIHSEVRARDRVRAQVEQELEFGAAAAREHAGLRERRAELEARRRELAAATPRAAPLAQKVRLFETVRELEQAAAAEESAFREALSRRLAALRIEPDHAGARAAIASLAFDELVAAQTRRDRARAQSMEALVLAHDDGTLAARLAARGRVEFDSLPADAELRVYRFTDAGFLRLPLPVSPDGAPLEGRLEQADLNGPWRYLRVEHAAPPALALEPGDAIVSVCAEPAIDAAHIAWHLSHEHWNSAEEQHELEVLRGGRLETLQIPPTRGARLEGVIEVRSPLELDTRSTPPLGGASLELDAGSYLALFAAAGVEARIPFEVQRDCKLTIRADLEAARPPSPEFVYVAPGPAILGGDRSALEPFEEGPVSVPEFFLARRELTFGEYFEFIWAIERSAPDEARQRAPRQPPARSSNAAPLWRDNGGHLEPALPGGVDLRWPVVGISYDDALAYCRWRNERDCAGEFEVTLPTEVEWEKAARGVDGRHFPWGDTFEWTLARLHISERVLGPTPGGMFPIDTSIYGVSDMCGNAREWCLAAPEATGAVLRGGAWGVRVENDSHLASRSNWRSRSFFDTGSTVRLAAHRRSRE